MKYGIIPDDEFLRMAKYVSNYLKEHRSDDDFDETLSEIITDYAAERDLLHIYKMSVIKEIVMSRECQ